jgi:hypothetical protein
MVSAAVAGMSGHVTTIFREDNGLETIYGPEDQLKHDQGRGNANGLSVTGGESYRLP